MNHTSTVDAFRRAVAKMTKTATSKLVERKAKSEPFSPRPVASRAKSAAKPAITTMAQAEAFAAAVTAGLAERQLAEQVEQIDRNAAAFQAVAERVGAARPPREPDPIEVARVSNESAAFLLRNYETALAGQGASSPMAKRYGKIASALKESGGRSAS
jgi:hypothetical protein